MRSFVDTTFDVRKQRKAIDLLVELRRTREVVLSIQVLQEYFVTATQKLKLTPDFARRRLTQYGRFETIRPDLDLVLAAVDLHRLNQLSFWDALIIQSAIAGGCGRVLSEDLQHGAVLGGVRIVNPFAA